MIERAAVVIITITILIAKVILITIGIIICALCTAVVKIKRQHTFAHWGVPSDDWEYRFASPPGDILRLAQELKMAIKGRHHQLSAKGTKPDVKRVRSAP